MNKNYHYILTLIILIAFAPLTHAQLTWESKTIELKASINDTEAVGIFKFINNSDELVHIKSVKTSCGCTTTKLEKLDYAPGESGKIAATFKFGDRMGLNSKKIYVKTENPNVSMNVLTMKVDIPKLLEISHRFHYWKSGSKPVPRTTDILVTYEKPINITKVTVTNEKAFVADLKTIEPGRKYKLTITPIQTDNGERAKIYITTDIPAENPKIYSIYASVNAPKKIKQPVPSEVKKESQTRKNIDQTLQNHTENLNAEKEESKSNTDEPSTTPKPKPSNDSNSVPADSETDTTDDGKPNDPANEAEVSDAESTS